MNVPIADLHLLLRSLEPSLDPAVYAFVTVKRSAVLRSVPVFASVREPEGLSAVILESDAARLGLPVLFRASWISSRFSPIFTLWGSPRRYRMR